MPMNGAGDFELELERELHRILDPISAVPIPPRRAPISGGFTKRLLGGAGAALALKLATGVAVAAFAAAAAGVATEVAATGSLNPSNWGQSVTKAVQTCKDNLRASGTRGIGPCVSAIANQHGQQVSDSHRSSDARGNGKDKGKSDANSHDKGKTTGSGNSHRTPGSGGAGGHP
ncbi:MAG: hypothetical protein E6J40_04975 [Chloroflexi bacterium]|nr:MAG: hypothetical protein E6J40_04975 [Chloroflexota bacterium]